MVKSGMEKRAFQAALGTIVLLLILAVASSAQAGVHQQVYLPREGGAMTFHESVVRGDRDRYTVYARAGQRIRVRITAGESNAALQVIGPNGHFLPGAGEGMDAARWQGRLPLSGIYTIVVGGTRGNATYALTIAHLRRR